MMSRADWIAARRVFILRLLVQVDGEANEPNIITALEHCGYRSDAPDDFRADLEKLRHLGCVTEEWFGEMRVVTLTERGRLAAEGRVEVEGVERSPWKRH